MTQRRAFLANLGMCAAAPLVTVVSACGTENEPQFDRNNPEFMNQNDGDSADLSVEKTADEFQLNATLAEPTPLKVFNSPNQSNRNMAITGIVLHNTEAPYGSAFNSMMNSASQSSAHLLIDRDGKVTRLVRDSKKAWHARAANGYTLGIEIVAYNAQRGMTPAQEESVVKWLRYWRIVYGIQSKNITIHRIINNGQTDCPTFVWKLDKQFFEWRKYHFGV